MAPYTQRYRPILFSGDMIRAILDNRKTQTRRLIPFEIMVEHTDAYAGDLSAFGVYRDGLPYYNRDTMEQFNLADLPCSYGQAGDRLWVRETFMTVWRGAGYDRLNPNDPDEGIRYRATWTKSIEGQGWKPSLHMPRWASRITLEITETRPERLQDITEQDAIQEGVEKLGALWRCYGKCPEHDKGYRVRSSAVGSFMSLWDSLATQPGTRWADNPWVWVIAFRKVDA